MSEFAALLQRASARLSIPQPTRTRVLLEIAADCDDLYRHYLAAGLTPAAARARVEEEHALSDEALQALVELHAGPLRRLLDGLSAQARSRWERGLLLVLLGFVTMVAGRLVLTRGFFAAPSVLLWPVLALALLGLALALTKAWELFGRRDHDPRRLRRRLGAQLGIAAGELALGALGAWLELGAAAWRVRLAPAQAAALLVEGLRSGVVLAITAQIAALLAALAWFVLDQRVRRIENHEALLLQEILAEGPTEGRM